MRPRDFIAGTTATVALSLAKPVCAETGARTGAIKRIAFFHPTEPPEGLTKAPPIPQRNDTRSPDKGLLSNSHIWTYLGNDRPSDPRSRTAGWIDGSPCVVGQN